MKQNPDYSIVKYPAGFYAFGKNIGIKDKTPDFAVIYCDTICDAAAVFTKNNFPGSPVIVGKEHIRDGKLQAIVINSKNSNVATGEKGVQDARETCRALAQNLSIKAENILPSSTGVIGVALPIEKILNACKNAKADLREGNLDEAASAILTTDTRRKISVRNIETSQGSGVIYGMAKGAGMIEPNMATMLCYIVTDVSLQNTNYYDVLKHSVDKSFNCISIDSDTSTSDTVVLMASGKAGVADAAIFQNALDEICIDLAKMIAADGEGASKLIQLDMENARDESQARKIGKSILNSPLVKTAIYGADPNWGRLIMAIGKVFDEPIAYDSLEVAIGGIFVKNATKEKLRLISDYLKSNSEVVLQVNLNQGNCNMRFWGCDLTEGYVKENAYYTT